LTTIFAKTDTLAAVVTFPTAPEDVAATSAAVPELPVQPEANTLSTRHAAATAFHSCTKTNTDVDVAGSI
jgi:hypothetical protein